MLINKNSKRLKIGGFTIVELIVVIAIIGILATISYVSYNGIIKKAAISALKADLEKTASELSSYKSKKGEYPSSLSDVNVSDSDSDISYQYTVVDGSYCVAIASVKNDVTYNISSGSSEVKEGTCLGYVGS